MSLPISDSERTQASTPEQERVSALRSAPELFPDGYDMHEIVGQGGMGIVYRARDIALDRDIAIKMLQPHFAADSAEARRFVEEARITAQLQHPGIPAIHEVGTMANDRPFIAMKLIKGETLDALLKRPDTRTASFIATFEAIAFALGYAHSQNVIHRDLKPANIMVGAFGEVQVMDWGLAKVLASDGRPPRQPTDSSEQSPTETHIRSARDSDSDSETRHGDYMGTPAYMPPEQAIGAVDKIDARSDVFGLGAILCTMLTGHPPFNGGSAESTRQLAAQGKIGDAFARLDSCGAEPEWIALAKRCLSAEPNDRPANGTEVANEVAKLRAAADERAKQAEIGKARSDTRRRVLAWSAAAVFAVLSAGAITSWVLANQARDAEKATAAQLVRTEAEEKRAVGAEKATTAQLVLTQAAKSAAVAKTKEVEATLVVVGQRTKMLGDAYGDFVFDIQSMLENRPGTQDLRRALLEQARTGLKKILDEARKQGSPDHTLVVSHFRMGDIEQQLGNTLAAKKEYQAGHELAKQLADAEPKNALAQRDLSLGFENLGNVTLRLGQTKDALDFYQKGLMVSQRLADADPKNAQAQRDLSISFNNLGNVTLQLGQTKDALDFYQKCLMVRQRLADADPKNAEAQRDLSVSFIRLGDVMLPLGQTKDALDFYQKSLVIGQRLAYADPKNAEQQRYLSLSFERLGDVTLKLEQTKDAFDFYQKMYAIKQQLADADPKNAQAQRDLSVSFEKLGNVTLQLGRTKEALDFYQKGLAVSQRLADADPNNAGLQRDLSISFDKLGNITLKLGRTKEALDFYQKYNAIGQRLADADPKNAQARRDLSISFGKLGDVTLQLGQTRDALDFYQKYNAICQRLADADPNNAVAQRDLSVSFEKLGNVTRQLGRTKDALDFYRKGLAVSQWLADADPKNVVASTNLFINLYKLGELEYGRNNFAEAADWFGKARNVLLPWHEKKLLDGQFLNAVPVMDNKIAACHKAEKSLADLDFAMKQPNAEVPGLLDIRVQVFAKKNDQKNLLATAIAYEKLASADDRQLYNAACAWSLASGLAKEDAKLREEYAVKAMAILRRTPTGKGHFVDSPAKLAAHMKQDADMNPLRERADFQKLLAELEAPPKPRELAPPPRAK